MIWWPLCGNYKSSFARAHFSVRRDAAAVDGIGSDRADLVLPSWRVTRLPWRVRWRPQTPLAAHRRMHSGGSYVRATHAARRAVFRAVQ